MIINGAASGTSKLFSLGARNSDLGTPIPFLYRETRPKPVEHGYLFSMAVGTIGEWLKLVPFIVVDYEAGGGGAGSF